MKASRCDRMGLGRATGIAQAAPVRAVLFHILPDGLTFKCKSTHGGSCRQATAAESIALNNGIASPVREEVDAWVHKRWTQCA
jgi:hypothetical protein